VPQMADAEAVAAALHKRPGVRYIGLWLSESGYRRARATQLDLATSVLCATSDTLALKNNGCNAAELIRRQGALVEAYRNDGLQLDYAHVSSAFGCSFEGRISADQTMATIADLLAVCSDHGLLPRRIYLSDTVGAASPASVTALIGKVRERWPDQAWGLHLHDTRGLGLANAWAGLQLGIDWFDASIGGMGGCPGATGNICTEDLALLCAEAGIDTGLDLDALIGCARLAEEIAGQPLPGKLMKAGQLPA